ncbi:MAG: Thermonuclease precursor [Pseudomonadota bacterium]|jgi:endonuclease YncB( thermonuclease family)
MNLQKLIALIWLCMAMSLNAATLQGKVVSVADGDTVTVLDSQKTQYKIRLQGIDAPERAQAFGNKSKQSLHEIVHGKQVTVDYQKKDKYGRVVGKILLNNTDVCLEQLKRGMAWHYKQYANEQPKEDQETYSLAEQQAKTELKGLWKDKQPVPPWEFRKQNK